MIIILCNLVQQSLDTPASLPNYEEYKKRKSFLYYSTYLQMMNVPIDQSRYIGIWIPLKGYIYSTIGDKVEVKYSNDDDGEMYVW